MPIVRAILEQYRPLTREEMQDAIKELKIFTIIAADSCVLSDTDYAAAYVTA